MECCSVGSSRHVLHVDPGGVMSWCKVGWVLVTPLVPSATHSLYDRSLGTCSSSLLCLSVCTPVVRVFFHVTCGVEIGMWLVVKPSKVEGNVC